MDVKSNERGDVGTQIGSQAGTYAGAAIGGYLGGPLGAAIGEQIGSDIGSEIGSQVEDEDTEAIGSELEGLQRNKGGCSGNSGGAGMGKFSTSDAICHESPSQPKLKLEIEENDIPENWWDKLPDFDPRIYDAISIEQAAACVDYIFNDLPDMHDVENMIESNKNPKTCPRLKVQVPRTKVVRPKEIIYDTRID